MIVSLELHHRSEAVESCTAMTTARIAPNIGHVVPKSYVEYMCRIGSISKNSMRLHTCELLQEVPPLE